MAAYPYGRVSHLTGLTAPYLGSYGHKSTATPDTLTGDAQSLYSYALCILFRDERGYWLHVRDSSRTTNRHIDAVQSVLGTNGYVKTGEYRTIARGMDRYDVYELLTKEG